MTIYSNDQYYVAKIQIRPYDTEVIEALKKYMKERSDILISKEEELKTGIDFYVTSIKGATALGQKLKRRFKGKLIITKKLYGQDKLTSRMLWRVTVLFRRDEKKDSPEDI